MDLIEKPSFSGGSETEPSPEVGAVKAYSPPEGAPTKEGDAPQADGRRQAQNIEFLSGYAESLKTEDGERRFFAVEVHPSRTAPLCLNCQHHVLVGGIKPACNHPAQPIYLDDGEPWVNPHRARTEQQVCADRGLFFCSPSGLGFTPRVG